MQNAPVVTIQSLKYQLEQFSQLLLTIIDQWDRLEEQQETEQLSIESNNKIHKSTSIGTKSVENLNRNKLCKPTSMTIVYQNDSDSATSLCYVKSSFTEKHLNDLVQEFLSECIDITAKNVHNHLLLNSAYENVVTLQAQVKYCLHKQIDNICQINSKIDTQNSNFNEKIVEIQDDIKLVLDKIDTLLEDFTNIEQKKRGASGQENEIKVKLSLKHLFSQIDLNDEHL